MCCISCTVGYGGGVYAGWGGASCCAAVARINVHHSITFSHARIHYFTTMQYFTTMLTPLLVCCSHFFLTALVDALAWGALGHVFGFFLLASTSLQEAGECDLCWNSCRDLH